MPAVVAGAILYLAIGLPVVVGFGDAVVTASASVAMVAFLAHCAARPLGVLGVGIVVMPGVVRSLLIDQFGAPNWIGLPLVPIALLLLWAVDDDRAAVETDVGP